jgi:uncharacterized circularly permuted ATP-grasp superfamily protein/uncharacterized alpha-E superfamily protein
MPNETHQPQGSRHLSSLAKKFFSYCGSENSYDEFLLPDGSVRPRWQPLLAALETFRESDFEEARRAANQLLIQNDASFNGKGSEGNLKRPWQIDLLPVVFDEEDWEPVRRGVAQRARLIKAIAEDLYGPQTLISEGLLPSSIVFRNADFHHCFHQLPRDGSDLLLYGCELARSPSGEWWVLSDRSSAPSGISYAVENRIVASKTLPEVFHRCQVHRLAPFFVQMQSMVQRLSPKKSENPSAVILSAGMQHPFYFEDVFLSHYLGYTLVEADDLAVRKNKVWIKTLGGLVPVDVILRRESDSNLDPLEISYESSHGVAGLLQAIRHRNVAIGNGPEYSLMDSPAFMPFLQKLCRHIFDEDLLIPSIATWWCGAVQPLEYVLAHLEQLVIKPAFQRSGTVEYIYSELTKKEQEGLRVRILADPEGFVAQEKIVRSTSPCWNKQALRPGHVALRTFAVNTGEEFDVMNGGLVRVQDTSQPMPLSISAGYCSKDVWINSSKPVETVSLLKTIQDVPQLQRANYSLSSRVADNLFWLGTYLERLEFSARMMRKVTERLISESDFATVRDIDPLISTLAKQGLISESLSLESFRLDRWQLERNWCKIISDTEETRRFSGVRAEVDRLATTVRDRVSEDFWRAISHLRMCFPHDPASHLSQSLDTFNLLILSLSATAGQITDGLVEGPVRYFLKIGAHLERARQLSLLLEDFLPSQNDLQTSDLMTLLEVCNSSMTYRSRYRAILSPLPVLDLLVTEVGNPRSILHQFHELQAIMRKLPNKSRPPQLPAEAILLRDVIFRLESLLPSSDQNLNWMDYRSQLSQLLPLFQSTVTKVTERLNEKYFVHTHFSQQIENVRKVPHR